MPTSPNTAASARAPRLTTQSFYENDAWKKTLVVAGISQIPIAIGDIFAGRALRAIANEQPFASDVAMLAICHGLPSALHAYSSVHATVWGAQSCERVVDGITQRMFGQTAHWVEGRPRLGEHAQRLANDVPWVLGMLVGLAPKRAQAVGGLVMQAVLMGVLLEPVIALSLMSTVAVAYVCSALSERADIRELSRSKRQTMPLSDSSVCGKNGGTASSKEGEEPHLLFGRVREHYWDNVVLGNTYNLARWLAAFKQIGAIHGDDEVRREQSKASYNSVSGLLSGLVLGGTLALYGHRLHQRGDQQKLVTVFFPLLARAASIMGQAQDFLGNNQELLRHERIFARLLDETQADAKLRLLDKVSPDLCISDAAQTKYHVATLLADAPKAGRLTIYDRNGRGKSMFAAAFKQEFGSRAWLLPASHELLFDAQAGSSGETAMANLVALGQDVKAFPEVRAIFLDEWDANLDATNRAVASGLIDALAREHLVIEITHAAAANQKQKVRS